MGLSVYAVSKEVATTQAKCRVCSKKFKFGDIRVDIHFGSGWPAPRRAYESHYHAQCFLEIYGDKIAELHEYLLIFRHQQTESPDPDNRITGVLETME